MPGVAFTRNGGRMGHGMGYYDKYLADLFATNPQRYSDPLDLVQSRINVKLQQKKTILIGLALREQIIKKPSELPLDANDVLLDEVVTAD